MPLYQPKALSDAEFASLIELSKGPIHETVLTEEHAKLISLGYARKAPDGKVVITDAGQMRNIKGRYSVD
jgi:Mn-dependent DtxR family transcriptional regulator